MNTNDEREFSAAMNTAAQELSLRMNVEAAIRAWYAARLTAAGLRNTASAVRAAAIAQVTTQAKVRVDETLRSAIAEQAANNDELAALIAEAEADALGAWVTSLTGWKR